MNTENSVDLTLNDVLRMDELTSRPALPVDERAVTEALLKLNAQLSVRPDAVLQNLAQTAMELCGGHSAGVSLLEDTPQTNGFRWRGVAGRLAPHLDALMPRNSPCGEVLNQGKVLLFSRPETFYRFSMNVETPLVEAVLAPFRAKDCAIGTVWVVAHDDTVIFTSAEAQILGELAEFAGAAYHELSTLGYILCETPTE